MKAMKRLRFVAACIAIVGFSCLPAAADADASGDGGVTLAAALARALADSPQLQSFSFARRAAEARRVQAGLRPNPTLGVTLENIGGSGQVSGARALETTLMLSQLLELGDKRATRSALAASRIGALEADYAITRLDVLAEVARRFVHTARAQLLLEVARAAIELAEANADAVQKRVEAARVHQAELERAEIAVARATIALEHREHELLSSKRRLAAAWGSEAVDFDQVHARLFEQPTPRPLENLLEELRVSPDLARFASARRVRQAELALARARSVQNLRAGVGLRRLERSDDHALVFNLSVPLPLFDRNQGNVAAADAELARITVDERARFLDAQVVLFTTYQELLHARTETRILTDTIIPRARAALAEYEAGYAHGRFSYLELAEARAEFIALRSEAIRAAATFHMLVIEVERLSGIGIGPAKEHRP